MDRTAQALNYRHEMDIPNDSVAMSVVIQLMVPADVSGVLFTANPTSGERSEMIINGSFGLGEAVVSGQVTPDTYVIDRSDMTVKETVIGAEAQMIISDGTTGVVMRDVEARERERSSVPQGVLMDLANVALSVEREFDGVPQDIEWAIRNGQVHLLQSRPITHLPPPPLGDVRWDPIAGAQLIKRQVAENMQDPLSPLFEDLYFPALHAAQQWPNYKNIILETVNGYAYQRINDDGFKIAAAEEARPLLQRIPAIVRGYFDFYARSVSTWRDRELPRYLAIIEQWRNVKPSSASDRRILEGLVELTMADARYWIPLRYVIGVSKLTDNALQDFLQRNAADRGFTSGTFLSGFDSRTLRAEADMRAIAEQIRASEHLRMLVLTTPAKRLLDTLGASPESRSVCNAIARYLDDYGHQVYNLDFVEPAQAEDPLPFLMSLKSLVQHGGYRQQDRQIEVATQRKARLREANRFFRGINWFKWRYFLWMARHYYPHREEAFFYLGAAWAVLRPLALELGNRLVTSGTLARPDHVFYLTREELQQAISARDDQRSLPDLGVQAQARQQLRMARSRLNQPQTIPPMEGADHGALSTIRDNADHRNRLHGFAVSPGTVTGEVSVILSPAEFDQMKPGTILVCPLTTPAWTQLFPLAIGLVTDIGSILAHGSIVAREYGIPAVLGVGDITQRVASGERITIDGDQGTVSLDDQAMTGLVDEPVPALPP